MQDFTEIINPKIDELFDGLLQSLQEGRDGWKKMWQKELFPVICSAISREKVDELLLNVVTPKEDVFRCVPREDFPEEATISEIEALFDYTSESNKCVTGFEPLLSKDFFTRSKFANCLKSGLLPISDIENNNKRTKKYTRDQILYYIIVQVLMETYTERDIKPILSFYYDNNSEYDAYEVYKDMVLILNQQFGGLSSQMNKTFEEQGNVSNLPLEEWKSIIEKELSLVIMSHVAAFKIASTRFWADRKEVFNGKLKKEEK